MNKVEIIPQTPIPRSVKFAILVAALGYFVDAFDLLLFSIVRVASLSELGLVGDELLEVGKSLLNWQMWGLLLGGILWGVLGDRVGRIQVLFGSILLYSIATLLNGFITDVSQYACLRFLAGLGLAGELGGGITLIAELMPREKRGLGTTFVTCVGVFGVVVAGLVGKLMPWRTAYIVGGTIGLLLLLLRAGVHESGVFRSLNSRMDVRKGDLRLLLWPPERLLRYLACIVIATPTWFLVGIIVTFCKELGVAKGMESTLVAADAVMWTYVGLTAGDLTCGLFSQWLKSRKRAVLWFLSGESVFLCLLLILPISEPWQFYSLCVPLGFFVGYWVVFVTSAAEQFGTNLRATVATTVPNLVRGTTIIFTTAFFGLKANGYDVITAAAIVGFFTMTVAFIGAVLLKESFSTDLNFIES